MKVGIIGYTNPFKRGGPYTGGIEKHDGEQPQEALFPEVAAKTIESLPKQNARYDDSDSNGEFNFES